MLNDIIMHIYAKLCISQYLKIHVSLCYLAVKITLVKEKSQLLCAFTVKQTSIARAADALVNKNSVWMVFANVNLQE